MRTVHDLEAAFADLADSAPDPDVLTVPVEAPRRRSARRGFAPAVAALVTAAVIGGVLVATLPGDGSDRPAAPTTLQALQPPTSDGPADTTFRFTADDPVSAITVRRYGVDRGGQQLEFRTPPDGSRCVTAGDPDVVNVHCHRVASVTLLYGGRPTASDVRAFDPDKISNRVAQDVDGKRGYFGTYGNDPELSPELAGGKQGVHLYWQYAPGAWGDALAATRPEALTLARSVRAAELPLTVPVELRPLDHQYLNIIDSEQSTVGGSYEITSEDAEYGLAGVAWGDGDRDSTGETVQDRVSLTIDGRTWTFETRNDQAEAVLQDSSVPVTISGYVGMSRATLQAIVERVRLAPDLSDRGTWFRAADLRSQR